MLTFFWLCFLNIALWASNNSSQPSCSCKNKIFERLRISRYLSNSIKTSSNLNSFNFDRDDGRRTRILETCQNWRDKINKRDREDNKNTTNSHLWRAAFAILAMPKNSSLYGLKILLGWEQFVALARFSGTSTSILRVRTPHCNWPPNFLLV